MEAAVKTTIVTLLDAVLVFLLLLILEKKGGKDENFYCGVMILLESEIYFFVTDIAYYWNHSSFSFVIVVT